MPKPIILTILDGWGYSANTQGNAIALARKPTYDKLLRDFPNTLIRASEHFVGLPDGQMGNSEVGHLNLGAGSVIMQDLTRIDDAARTGALSSNAVLLDAFSAAPRVHLIGLASEGGVHSSLEHLRALIALAATLGVPDLIIHVF